MLFLRVPTAATNSKVDLRTSTIQNRRVKMNPMILMLKFHKTFENIWLQLLDKKFIVILKMSIPQVSLQIYSINLFKMQIN